MLRVLTKSRPKHTIHNKDQQFVPEFSCLYIFYLYIFVMIWTLSGPVFSALAATFLSLVKINNFLMFGILRSFLKDEYKYFKMFFYWFSNKYHLELLYQKAFSERYNLGWIVCTLGRRHCLHAASVPTLTSITQTWNIYLYIF